jgi:hypothetical protein
MPAAGNDEPLIRTGIEFHSGELPGIKKSQSGITLHTGSVPDRDFRSEYCRALGRAELTQSKEKKMKTSIVALIIGVVIMGAVALIVRHKHHSDEGFQG